jgi:hypothetical protein
MVTVACQHNQLHFEDNNEQMYLGGEYNEAIR